MIHLVTFTLHLTKHHSHSLSYQCVNHITWGDITISILGVYLFDFYSYNFDRCLCLLIWHFVKDVKESREQEGDHKAGWGPKKQNPWACAKAIEEQQIDIEGTSSRFKQIWRVQSKSDQRSHSLCSGSIGTVADGLLPAAEQFSGDELVAVDGSPVLEPRTPAAEQSLGEGLLPAAELSSGSTWRSMDI